MGNGVMAPRINFVFGWKLEVSLTLPVSIVLEAGWAPEPIWERW
jgi:hypothetical protein